jgi:AcrR family transcriptional regulator
MICLGRQNGEKERVIARILVKYGIYMVFHDAVVGRSNLDITIKELCQLCDINRNTFYYHFASLDYLILWGFRKGLSTILNARFEKNSLVYDTGSVLEDDWGFAYYVDARNSQRDLELTGFWRALYEYLITDAQYFKTVFKCQGGAFLPGKHTNAYLMEYLFSIYYHQFYLDISYASQREPSGIILEDTDITMLSMWFTNATISLLICAINDTKIDSLPTALSFKVFDSAKLMNMSHDIIKLMFSQETFLKRQGFVG